MTGKERHGLQNISSQRSFGIVLVTHLPMITLPFLRGGLYKNQETNNSDELAETSKIFPSKHREAKSKLCLYYVR